MPNLDHKNTILELQDISFSYATDEVIKDVSLSIHKGDYVGLIGPNGGGKSTLLKIMLGLLRPQKGIVKIFNQDINHFKDWQKIGYVAQRNFFDASFPATVEEVVMMGRYGKLGFFHFPNKIDQKKVHQALQQVEMTEFKNRSIGDLSGGQQQRVFIARALVTEPEMIFLDEPTAGVDAKTQKQFYALLEKLNKQLNLTLIFISHELDILAHQATELGYINRTLDYFGDPKEFLKGEYFHELIGKSGIHH